MSELERIQMLLERNAELQSDIRILQERLEHLTDQLTLYRGIENTRREIAARLEKRERKE